MAQPIPIDFLLSDPHAEVIPHLRNAPAKHAEALLSAYEVLQGFHDRGVLDLLRGALASSDKLLEIVVGAVNSPEAIRGIRNIIILAKILGTIEPVLLENIAQSVPDSLAQQKPLSLWQLFKRMCSRDSRRMLSATVRIIESFGKSLGATVRASDAGPAERAGRNL